MATQFRFDPNDERYFSPSRDIAHHAVQVVEMVMKRCASRHWAEAEQLLADAGVPDEDLDAANLAFGCFLRTAVDNPKATMTEVLEASGFMKVHPLARVVYMAYLGQVTAGMYFTAVREATIGGQGPVSDVPQLVEIAGQLERLMTMPAWRRKLWGWWQKLRRKETLCPS